MERFWRTLREGCLDFLGSLSSLHEVNVRLWSWLDQHYHRAPHAGLLGACPQRAFDDLRPAPVDFDEAALRNALTVRSRRRVRRDTSVRIAGRDWELEAGHLVGRIVTLCQCMVDLTDKPWVEYEGRRYEVHPVDPVKNARRERAWRRPHLEQNAPPPPAFDPPKALLNKAVGKPPEHAAEAR
jgi:hypothetical protein